MILAEIPDTFAIHPVSRMVMIHFVASSAIAYTLMTNIYGFIIAVVVFLITLKTTKYVSLSSILGATAVLIASPFIGYSTTGIITNICVVALIVYRHRANIIRIKNGTENKVKWFYPFDFFILKMIHLTGVEGNHYFHKLPQ